ncbi:MAG: hypothetical protein IKK40_03235, partial [Bacteroidales bacterium]|nr:hypothetical protein [Bacteroidales bacterium]
FMHNELTTMVGDALRENDIFLIADIYYAGGTVDRNISSTIVSDAMKANGKNAEYVHDKDFSLKRIKELCLPNDAIIIMGARDPHLDEFANKIYGEIR